MIRQADLKEAGEIISGLTFLNKALAGTVPETPSNHSPLELQGAAIPGYKDRYYHEAYTLTLAARQAAHKVMRQGWEARAAQLRRRAAQIGLLLEEGL